MGVPFIYELAWNQKLSRNEWSVSLSVAFSIYPVSNDNRKKAEEHYWKGIQYFGIDDYDNAILEFKEARSYNIYYKDIGKKIRDLTEMQKLKKENIQQEEEEEKKEKEEKMDTIKKNRTEKSEK
jgi:hypothetical protein